MSLKESGTQTRFLLYVFIWLDLILGEMLYSGIDANNLRGSQALARHHLPHQNLMPPLPSSVDSRKMP